MFFCWWRISILDKKGPIFTLVTFYAMLCYMLFYHSKLVKEMLDLMRIRPTWHFLESRVELLLQRLGIGDGVRDWEIYYHNIASYDAFFLGRKFMLPSCVFLASCINHACSHISCIDIEINFMKMQHFDSD